MNYQQIIMNLVVDGHMDYESVLDLTPYQIAAITAENSSPPGEMLPDVYKELTRA